MEKAPLTFAALREANMLRLPRFKNKHGQHAHAVPDGSDWSPAQWLQAVVGELGEYANVRKKFERGDLTLEEYGVLAAKELADVQTYLDILALRALDVAGTPHPTGIDLGAATHAKFNEVSYRVGANVFINDSGIAYLHEAKTFLCPRRDENPGGVFKLSESDHVRVDGSCSYCGSLDGDIFMERLEAGTIVLRGSDKDYKAYIAASEGSPPLTAIKFYFQHLSTEQRMRFVDLWNENRIAHNGLYVMPFFMARVPREPAA